MVPGLNTNVDRDGRAYHVQTEDFGRKKPIIQSLIYLDGQVITALESSYEGFAQSEEFSEDEIRRKLNGQHYRLVAEIESGAFDVAGDGTGGDADDGRAADPVDEYLGDATPYDERPGAPHEQAALPGEVEFDVDAGVSDEASQGESPVEIGQDHPVAADCIPCVPVRDVPTDPGPEPGTVTAGAGVEPGPSVPSAVAEPVAAAPVSPAPESGRAVEPRIVIDVQPSVEDRCRIDVRQVVRVHQAVEAHEVVEVGQTVGGVLERLDERLDRPRAQGNRRRSLPWIGVAGLLALIVLAVAGWWWRAGQPATRISESRTATPPQAAVAELQEPMRPQESSSSRAAPPVAAGTPSSSDRPAERRAPEAAPIEVPVEAPPARVEAPSRAATPEPVAPDAHGEPPPASPSPVSPDPLAETATPAAVAGGDSGPPQADEAAATLAPPVPRPPADAPDPLLEAEAKRESTPAVPAPPEPAPPVEPRAPARKVRPGMLLELAEVDVAPEPMQREFPEYPKRARKKNRQGNVRLDLLIDERGNVARIKLADGVAESDLSDAAVAAARGWKYTPARKDRHAVRVWKPVTVRFTLDAGNASRVRVEE